MYLSVNVKNYVHIKVYVIFDYGCYILMKDKK